MHSDIREPSDVDKPSGDGGAANGAEADTNESKVAVVAALCGNAALSVLKGISAAATGSAAMLAETLHSIADTGNEALLLLGMRAARRPPDEQHPFGYGKNVYFWAFVVSVMLFTVGGAFSVWEGVRKLLHGGEHAMSLWVYAVLAGAFVFEAASLAVAVRSLLSGPGRPLARRILARDPRPHAPHRAPGRYGGAGGRGGRRRRPGAGAGHREPSMGRDRFPGHRRHSPRRRGRPRAGEPFVVDRRASSEDVERMIRDALARDAAVVSIDRIRTMHVGPHEIIAMLAVRLRDDLTATDVVGAIARLHALIETALARDVRPRFVAIEPVGRVDPGRRPEVPVTCDHRAHGHQTPSPPASDSTWEAAHGSVHLRAFSRAGWE